MILKENNNYLENYIKKKGREVDDQRFYKTPQTVRIIFSYLYHDMDVF
jgi:hypothetical protein